MRDSGSASFHAAESELHVATRWTEISHEAFVKTSRTAGTATTAGAETLTIGWASGLPLGVVRLSIIVLSDENSIRAKILYFSNIWRNELMSTRYHGLETWARFSRRSLALACATLFLVTSSTRAGTVLQFAQANANDIVTASESGSVTTLSTASPLNADGGGFSIPVVVTNFLGIPVPPGTILFETFVGVHSTDLATSSGGTISQLFAGTIEFTGGINGTGGNFLTATFTNAVFSGSANTTGLNVSAPNLTLTSDFATLPPITGMSISFSGIAPPLSITGGSVAGFTAQNAGTFSATVPEPSALCLGSLAVVIGTLTAFGRKRMKNETAN
jgi:hypothetical protein